ncbi:PilZ domain-containing protein [Reinekea sp.]|jgi:hypothetical protein|uniref:PilZ domain-containing protein n=1 Tax=Reinekea sp. TaxID=1970455 RepID=UPI002A83989E|nr:PilZ domain-containing protein [Reinekea sp.]
MNVTGRSLEKRKFHRLALNARVQITDQQQQSCICQCVDFSEDGLDLELPTDAPSFAELSIRAGTVISVQFLDLNDAPVLQAAVVKIARSRVGLKLIG